MNCIIFRAGSQVYGFEMKSLLFSFTALLLFLVACNPSINSSDLYGEWKYVKVGNPNHSPPDSVSSSELEIQSPSITFSEKGDLVIFWGKKKLSYGKFRLEGNVIRYTENLPKGKIREFPFLIVDLSANDLTFQTMEHDATYVKAKRVK